MNLTFHDNIVPRGEQARRYNYPGNIEICAVAINLEDRDPPLFICHRKGKMVDVRPKLDIISDTDGQYDRILFVLLFPDGGNDCIHQ